MTNSRAPIEIIDKADWIIARVSRVITGLVVSRLVTPSESLNAALPLLAGGRGPWV